MPPAAACPWPPPRPRAAVLPAPGQQRLDAMGNRRVGLVQVDDVALVATPPPADHDHSENSPNALLCLSQSERLPVCCISSCATACRKQCIAMAGFGRGRSPDVCCGRSPDRLWPVSRPSHSPRPKVSQTRRLDQLPHSPLAYHSRRVACNGLRRIVSAGDVAAAARWSMIRPMENALSCDFDAAWCRGQYPGWRGRSTASPPFSSTAPAAAKRRSG